LQPRFSVVMPVRNAMPFLDEAVRSILVQGRGDFEFVILDDASTDGSRERLRLWAGLDRRIRLIESERPLGPAGSSNRVALAAACPIVARMDADDVAHPDRFRRQLEVLDRHPDAVLVGSLIDSIDSAGRLVRRRDRSALLRAAPVPIPHNSIMYRADAFRRIGGYREEAAWFEDTDLFPRLAREGRILIIPRALVRRRFSGANARLREAPFSVEQAIDRYYRRSAEGGGRPGAGGAGRVAPGVILGLAAMQLWAGERPHVLSRLVRRGRLGWDRGTASALGRALWATTSPGTLRTALRLRDAWREATLGRYVDDDAVYEWRPPGSEAPKAAAAPLAPQPALT